MASRTKNLTMDQGADFIYTTEVYGSKAALNKLGVGAGDTANAQMRKSYYHTNAVATFGISMDGDNSTVTMYLAAANTANTDLGCACKTEQNSYQILCKNSYPQKQP